MFVHSGQRSARELCGDETRGDSGGRRKRQRGAVQPGGQEARAAVLQAAGHFPEGTLYTRYLHLPRPPQPPTPQFRVRSVVRRHLRQAAKMKAVPWSPAPPLPYPHPSSDPPGSKGPGCCLLCHFGATVLLCCFFGAVSLRGRGSKPLTVSFRLPSRAFPSGAGGEGRGWAWLPAGKRMSPRPLPPPSRLPLSCLTDLQRETGSRHFPHILFTTRGQC